MGHTSVLLHESLDGLDIKAGDIYVDGTLGAGGHAEEVAKRFGKSVRIVGIDMDADAIKRSKKRFEKLEADATFVEGNFRNIDAILDKLKIGQVQRILLDIGLSSNQLDESGRGFTFREDEPLLMTFKKGPKEQDITARDVVNDWAEDSLEAIISGYGEERYARRIAKAIVAAREVGPIESTGELVAIVSEAVPAAYRRGRIHFATRTFQAIRIAVNDELRALQDGLAAGFERLAPGGRLAVISFHSLEDRIAKNFMKDRQTAGGGTIITKKPIVPSDAEAEENRRSRSAKLRIIKKN